MKSHEYEFDLRTALAALLGPLAWVAIFALLVKGGSLLGVWPPNRPWINADQTILLHQTAASGSPQPAQHLLIGDSSCLMNVSVKDLQSHWSKTERVLGLGTLSYLDLESYALLLRRFVAANPGQLRTVLLLMHPEALRRSAPEEQFVTLLNHFALPASSRTGSPLDSPWKNRLGLTTFRDSILRLGLATPLRGSYGQYYGFTENLWKTLRQEQGSAVDPRSYDPAKAQGNAEYRLAQSLKAASQRFRQSLPSETKLVLGVTPSPASFVDAGHVPKCREMLRLWGEWIGADMVLSELPFALPDSLFASVTHLNEIGRKTYTRLVASALNP